MSNINTTNTTSMANRAADAIGVAAEWTADLVQDTAMETGVLLIAGYARTERVVVQLATNRSGIYQAAAAKADARIAARLARRGVTMN